MVKETYLHDKHVALGAKMIDFGGWHMPVQYSSIIEEHKTVRENVGLFDVSHMGEVFVSGKDAEAFLNKIVPQDITKLDYEKAVYCQLPKEDGGLIDDLIIYKLGIEKYLVICNASRVDEDINWISRNHDYLNRFGVMNVYGMHLASLETTWLADELADHYSKEFNVRWNRENPLTILGGINLEGDFRLRSKEFVHLIF